MNFANLPAGESIFLDANPLVYHFAADALFGPSSSQLVARVEKQEVSAYTSTHVLSETSHHLMTLEAAVVFGWTSKIVSHLKRQPSLIQNLTKFRQAIERVPLLGIQVLIIPSGLIATATQLCQQFGLLSNDGLIVAIMQANGLTNLASNDPDFDRVPWIVRFAPM